MSERITPVNTDNRDVTETWLEIFDDLYVVVNPTELFFNALENTGLGHLTDQIANLIGQSKVEMSPDDLKFNLYCKTCEQDLEFDPEADSVPFCINPEINEDGPLIYQLDLSWHYCECDQSEGDEPNWVIVLR